MGSLRQKLKARQNARARASKKFRNTTSANPFSSKGCFRRLVVTVI